MNPNNPSFLKEMLLRAKKWTALILFIPGLVGAQQATSSVGAQAAGAAAGAPDPVCSPAILGSPYIPVDSWIYPAIWRLYSLGYVDTVFLGERPWTRARVARMLEDAGARLVNADAAKNPAADQAQSIYEAVSRELEPDLEGPCGPHQGSARIESVYTIGRGISGTPLDDSFHLGQTVINDSGRPYQNGFNNYSGISGYATAGRFALYARAEFQGSPSAAGYSPALAQALAQVDNTVNPVTGVAYPGQTTIPEGPIATISDGRFLEAYVSYQYLNNMISFGKQDQWLSPAQGASFAYSNNAQNIYGLEINRVEPLHVPLLSRLTGPFRYEFLLGALRGHQLMPNPLSPAPNQPNVISPGDPWVHLEKLSFRPTANFELGFERTVIWGGEGHSPVTIGNFLRSFFSTYSPAESIKFGREDPGARFGAFDFSYRLPFVRNWLTLYADSEVHDDVSPLDAPRRAAIRPGIYLSHVPGVPRLDLRVESASTDPASSTVSTREYGHFMYWETIEEQGYTNQGQIFGDWIGREDKGGQAWLTYHLSGNEWVQINARNQKATKDFIPGSPTQTIASGPFAGLLIPGGTTLNDFGIQAVKQLARGLELNGNFTFEHWKAPIYLPGQQTVTTTSIQLLWRPQRKVSF